MITTDNTPMTRLSEGVIKDFCELLKRGWTIQNVCGKTGVSVSSYKIWRNAGMDILEMYEYDERLAIRSINANEGLNHIDKKVMRLHVKFVINTLIAEAELYGELEEHAHIGAMSDDTGRLAVELLQRRRPKDWAKQVAPAVMIESHPIRQIVIHGSDVKQLEEATSVEAEYEDV